MSEGGDVGVNVYGASYHLERHEAKARNVANQFNPGLGLRYRWRINERFDGFVDAGTYRDSGRGQAVVAGPGLFWKPGGEASGWRAGGALAFVHSANYNGGRAFVAPFPLLAYEWRSITVNMTFIPRISKMNDINTIGLWVTFFPQ